MHTDNKPTINDNVEIIEGEYHNYKDWSQDPKGYFLIRVDREKKVIELGFCRENNIIDVIIRGEIPQEIYYTAVKKNLISKLEHAAYLGKELEKAYLALKNDLEYVQDEELEIKKS